MKGFTERQLRLIEKCKATGWGWKKFALSVEAQGFCTPVQEDCLVKMWSKIQHAELRKAGKFKSNRNYCWDSDASDWEAYQSGDYF